MSIILLLFCLTTQEFISVAISTLADKDMSISESHISIPGCAIVILSIGTIGDRLRPFHSRERCRLLWKKTCLYIFYIQIVCSPRAVRELGLPPLLWLTSQIRQHTLWKVYLRQLHSYLIRRVELGHGSTFIHSSPMKSNEKLFFKRWRGVHSVYLKSRANKIDALWTELFCSILVVLWDNPL